MQTSTKIVRIFVASPGDVSAERARVSDVVEELNRTTGQAQDFRLELVKWETHAHPDLGRPQGLINQQVGHYDIFIGIMWKRFGSPTGHAESGTEEEFQLAYDSWVRTNRPRVLFYFCKAPYTLSSPDDLEQLRKVLIFRQELQTKGLFWEYDSHECFADVLRPHLSLVLEEMFASDRPPETAEANLANLEPLSDTAPSSAAVLSYRNHCIPDLESVERLALQTAEGATRIQWHTKITTAISYVEQWYNHFDDLLMVNPWFKSVTETTRQSTLLVLHAEVDRTFLKIIRLLKVYESALDIVLTVTKESEKADRRRAINHFASFAALQIIRILQRLEGSLPDGDGKPQTFFYDVPRCVGTLLELEPQQSLLGALVFGEEYFLRARIGMTETVREYVLLPSVQATYLHSNEIVGDVQSYYSWVLPQWLVYGFSNLPPPANWRVWVLMNGEGREKYVPRWDWDEHLTKSGFPTRRERKV